MFAGLRIHKTDVKGSGKAEVRRRDAELRGALVDIVPVGVRAEDQLLHRKLRPHGDAAVGGIAHADLIGISVRGNQGSGEHDIFDHILLFGLCLLFLTRFLLGGEDKAEGEAVLVEFYGPVPGAYKSAARFPEAEGLVLLRDIGQTASVNILIQTDLDVPGGANTVIAVVKVSRKGLAALRRAGYRTGAHGDMQLLRGHIDRAAFVQQRHIQQHERALIIPGRRRIHEFDEHGSRRHGLGEMPADLDRHAAVGVQRLNGAAVEPVPDGAAPEHGLGRIQVLIAEGHLARADRQGPERELLRRGGGVLRGFFRFVFRRIFCGVFRCVFRGFFCCIFCIFCRIFRGLFRIPVCLPFYVLFRLFFRFGLDGLSGHCAFLAFRVFGFFGVLGFLGQLRLFARNHRRCFRFAAGSFPVCHGLRLRSRVCGGERIHGFLPGRYRVLCHDSGVLF